VARRDAPSEDGVQQPEAAVPMRLTEQGRARTGRAVATPADPRDTTFEGSRFSAIPFHARDTILGVLGPSVNGSARDRAALVAAGALLGSLTEGELPVSALSDDLGPGGRAVLENLIWAADSFDDVRMGIPVALTDRESSVPFRLMGERRYALGELILVKVGDEWYTADIQVEILDRDSTSRFDPGIARSDGLL